MLENGMAQQQAAQQQTQFMDKYGTKFSGDEGIGVAILAELGRRGIDTSAADEAVQDILDRIRAEATAILDKIKMDERTVSDLMDQVATVEEAVNAATGAAPGADAQVQTPPPTAEEMGMTPPPEEAALPPEEAAMPPEEAALPPEEMAAPPPEEEAPPPEIPSDRRLKITQGARARVIAAKTRRGSYTPSAGVLASLRGGMGL
jgi:outer membrane biosynthesis protein TonB